jgi:hypothetical protein
MGLAGVKDRRGALLVLSLDDELDVLLFSWSGVVESNLELDAAGMFVSSDMITKSVRGVVGRRRTR